MYCRSGLWALVLCFTCTAGYAQTADELIRKHVEAAGGMERIKALESKKMSGAVSNGGMEMDVTVYHKRPNKTRSEVDVQGARIVTAYDGTTAWMVNPMTGDSAAHQLPAEQAKAVRDDIDGPLIDYQEKGYTIAYSGEADVAGSKAHRLDLTTGEGELMAIYLDAETYLVVKQEQDAADPMTGESVKIETYLGDYRKVDGLMHPFVIEIHANGQLMQQITIDEVVVNPDVEDALFAFPAN